MSVRRSAGGPTNLMVLHSTGLMRKTWSNRPNNEPGDFSILQGERKWPYGMAHVAMQQLHVEAIAQPEQALIWRLNGTDIQAVLML